MPCVAARSRTVSTRIDPVKCRCRWAFGRSRTVRVMRVSVSPAPRSRPSSGVDHLVVAEPVVLGVDRVGVVAADAVLVEAALVVGGAVGRGRVRHLLADALVDRLVEGLLVGGRAVGVDPLRAVVGGVAPVQHVVEVAVLEGVLGLELVLVVDAVGRQVVGDVLVGTGVAHRETPSVAGFVASGSDAVAPSPPAPTRAARSCVSFSAAARATQVATPAMAVRTSSSTGKVGARRMLRSRGSLPCGKEAPAGVSAMPASLARATTREAVPSSTSRLTK